MNAEGRGEGGEVPRGQGIVVAGDAVTLGRSGTSSVFVDAFYYLDIIPCNFSKCIFIFIIQVDWGSWIFDVRIGEM